MFNINTRNIKFNLIYFNYIDNTIKYIKNNINTLTDGTVVFTTNQKNGYGSNQRTFISIPRKTLAISILLRNKHVNILPFISMLFSIVLIKTLKILNIEKAKIKWFNDIIINKKKIAGILCESLIQGLNSDVILSVGLNFLGSKKEFENIQLPNAGSIYSESGIILNYRTITQQLLINLDSMYNYISDNSVIKNKKYIKNLYTKYCDTIGKNIEITDKNYNTKKSIATAIKISDTGELICRKNYTIFKINCINTSIRTIQ